MQGCDCKTHRNYNMKLILAIDPGKSGGLAITDNFITKCYPMPKTEGDVVDMIRSLTLFSNAGVDLVCYIEKVGGYIKGNKAPGSAMFNFGHGRGVLIGALMSFGWRIIEVPPQRWQKWLGIGKCGGDKNKLKAEAQRRYPDQNVTLKTADALLILDYAKAQERV